MRRTRARGLVIVGIALAATLGIPIVRADPDAPPSRAAPPPPRGLEGAMRRFVSPTADPSHCTATAPVRGEHRYRCIVVECREGCVGLETVTVLGERDGRWRRVSRRHEEVGDHLACGHCGL